MKIFIIAIVAGLILMSCSKPENVTRSHSLPPIYPNYIDVAIPANVAPLNFLMRDSTDKIVVTISGSNDSIIVKGDQKIRIPMKHWKALLSAEQGKRLCVRVIARLKGNWVQYDPFYWYVKSDRIDPYLSYRLIEPGYEVWNKLQIVERNIESFDERVIADNNLTKGACMNCHIYGNQNASLSMFHLRGKNGGTILNRNGKLRKINTKGKGMISNAVYGNFHPSGRYAVFSTNIIIPELHAYRSERLEVYDTASDLVVLDFDKNETTTQPFISDSTALETFPVFSADGKWIYYCVAPIVPLPDSIKSLKYSICRVSFDADKGAIGTKVDTLWNAKKMGSSVCHLKTSPDGKYILYTVADYGTFPIWHQEADLQMMNLKTGKIDSLKEVNGPNSDSYHSWSSNSRWFVFASKRDDGIYGKPYFCYIDSTGKASKPFVLPQIDPSIYDNSLKSFNIPELSKGQTPYNASDIEQVYKNQMEEQIK
ncbi:MAG TPA: hypothetical protein VFC65_14520 [Prolixibacteraceae bacterium]|nr:hypothetical protein [Prolixibacteraceae bacterium]